MTATRRLVRWAWSAIVFSPVIALLVGGVIALAGLPWAALWPILLVLVWAVLAFLWILDNH